MTAKILDGKVLSAQIRNEVSERVAALKARGITPGLAVILVGNDPASEIYVRNKGKGCEETGMISRTIRMNETTTQEELESQIESLNRDPAIHGILVQLPLPDHLDENAGKGCGRVSSDQCRSFAERNKRSSAMHPQGGAVYDPFDR